MLHKFFTRRSLMRLLTPILALSMTVPFVAPASAVAAYTASPLGWGVIGLDSNTPATGPYEYPIGERFCVTGGSPIAGGTARWVWDNADNSVVSLTSPTDHALDITSGCVDIYWSVIIDKAVSPSLGTSPVTRPFHIEFYDGANTLVLTSTDTRYVHALELVSQNRNVIDSVSIDGVTPVGGIYTLAVGQTYTFRVTGHTSASYEELEMTPMFDGSVFHLETATVNYDDDETNVAVDKTVDSIFTDACGWDYTVAPGECTGPGQSGGNLVGVYTVTVVGTGSGDLPVIIYDFSGNSFHYNSDFGTGFKFAYVVPSSGPQIKLTDGTDTSTAITDTKYQGEQIDTVTVTVDPSSGAIDTYTVDCTPDLPAAITVTPAEGESVTAASGVQISGTLAGNAPIGTYECTITAYGPGGTSTTQYTLNVLPKAPAIKLTDGVETQTSISDTKTTGSAIDTVTVTVDPNSGQIDTYTITCAPPLPAYLVAVPTPNSGESVTSASQVSISGVLADTATVGTYNCTITAHGPGGTSETYYTLVVQPVLTLAVVGSGSVNPGVGTHPYLPNETVTITATPSTGWHFTGWTGACAEGPNPITVTMDASKSCTANFAIDTELVTYSPGTGSGTLAGGDTRTVNYGDTITVASPTGYSKTGWHFTGWQSGGSFQPGDVETITTNRTFTAQWEIDTHTLTTATVGTGSVTAGGVYNYGDTPTITATPGTGWHFVNWTGDCTGSTNPYTVTMTADKSCTANFAIDTHTLTTAKIGEGSVTPGGTYNYGDTVTLTATPASGWHFVGWTGACAEGPNPITLTMDADKSCTAIFEPNPIVTYKLTVSTVGEGTATPGTNWYNDGTKAVAVATPAAGWFFTGWTGACTGTAPTCEVLMTMDKAVTANFVKGVTITTHTNGNGSVKSSQPTGTPLLPGTKVTLTATPDEGWEFTGWSGSCSGTDNPLTVTLDVSKDCTANFKEKPKPVVEPLVAKNDTYRTAPNTPLRLPAGASILGNDGSTITNVALATKTKHGTIKLAANGKLVYTPNKGFVGIDSFKYKAFDANGRSVIATVKIIVAPKKPTDIKTGR